MAFLTACLIFDSALANELCYLLVQTVNMNCKIRLNKGTYQFRVPRKYKKLVIKRLSFYQLIE